MKAIFTVAITKPGGGIRFAEKKIQIDFVPTVGMQVADRVWGNSVAVESVTYDINFSELYVSLGKHATENQGDHDSILEMYKRHDWDVQD